MPEKKVVYSGSIGNPWHSKAKADNTLVNLILRKKVKNSGYSY